MTIYLKTKSFSLAFNKIRNLEHCAITTRCMSSDCQSEIKQLSELCWRHPNTLLQLVCRRTSTCITSWTNFSIFVVSLHSPSATHLTGSRSAYHTAQWVGWSRACISMHVRIIKTLIEMHMFNFDDCRFGGTA